MPTKEQDGLNSNPLLSQAMELLNSVAPGALDVPEKALRDLMPKLRFLVIGKVEKPTTAQLEAVRFLDKTRNLVQLRKAIQSGDLQFGPFPGDLAERIFMQELVRHGLSVSLRKLTAVEESNYVAP